MCFYNSANHFVFSNLKLNCFACIGVGKMISVCRGICTKIMSSRVTAIAYHINAQAVCYHGHAHLVVISINCIVESHCL